MNKTLFLTHCVKPYSSCIHQAPIQHAYRFSKVKIIVSFTQGFRNTLRGHEGQRVIKVDRSKTRFVRRESAVYLRRSPAGEPCGSVLFVIYT